MIDLNATKAAIRAGYSYKTAQEIGSENLSKPIIQTRISELRKHLTDICGVKAADVINELVKIAFSNVKDCVTDGNMLLDLKDIERDTAAGIALYQKVFKDNGKRKIQISHIRMHNKIFALALLGKHLGMFDKHNFHVNHEQIFIVE